MAENSQIEWTDHTFNPWEGCQKVGPGCDNCYAEARNARFSGGTAANWGPGAQRRRTSVSNWRKPLAWNAAHAEFFAAHGRRQRVFCASLADVFDNEVDREWRDDLATLILDTPNLDWLLLTKRIGNAGGMLGEMFLHGPPDTVWLGATIVNQKEADRDIPKLLATPARVRFLSMEPLIGPVNLWLPTRTWETGRGAFGTEKPVLLCNHCCNGDRCDDRTHVDRMHCAHCRGTGRGKPIDWVIVGGESGPKARPMHPDWARSLRDQCAAAGVPYLFKQWGEWLPISQSSEELTSRLYRSNRVAKLHEDQQAIDECYGRRCTVPSEVIHHDGTLHGITEPMAFQQGTAAMQAFRVGKKAAGRLLDGLTHDGFPEVRP